MQTNIYIYHQGRHFALQPCVSFRESYIQYICVYVYLYVYVCMYIHIRKYGTNVYIDIHIYIYIHICYTYTIRVVAFLHYDLGCHLVDQ